MQANEYYATCQLEVETFDFDYAQDSYECDCMTPGVPEAIEPEAIIKTVTSDELEAHVASKGFVTVTIDFNGEETGEVPFWRWAATMRDWNRVELMDILAEIINKRESRTNEWTAKHDVTMSFADPFGDTFDTIQSIVNSTKAA